MAGGVEFELSLWIGLMFFANSLSSKPLLSTSLPASRASPSPKIPPFLTLCCNYYLLASSFLSVWGFAKSRDSSFGEVIWQNPWARGEESWNREEEPWGIVKGVLGGKRAALLAWRWKPWLSYCFIAWPLSYYEALIIENCNNLGYYIHEWKSR